MESSASSATTYVWIEFLKILPALIWTLLGLILFKMLYRPLRHRIIPNLTSMKAMGFELSIMTKSLQAILEVAQKHEKWHVTMPEKDKEQVLQRVQDNLPLFQKAHFLWIDDQPSNNRNEIRMFNRLAVPIDTACNSAEAFQLLKTQKYDLIISDMARANEPNVSQPGEAGLAFLKNYRKHSHRVPVIFYIGEFDRDKGVPGGAFGITNRPDELLHLTMDVLSRRKNE